ncbi:glutamate receptor 2.5 [Quercus suber]|uniref:Glutamate receptor 2.5 n=1 Tax=Quercus suber TaxID=58331 RepID=A0AAW0KX69_QUESU
MNFDKTRLRTYKSVEECDELLSKGSANGGIAAAFDDFSCMKILLSQYCTKYTMVQSIYKTYGLGFAIFPKGSPFMSNVSRTILNVTEGEKMKEIEKTWLGDQSECSSSNTQISSGNLSLETLKDRGGIDIVQSIGTSDASPSTNCVTSPTSCSVHMEPKYTSSKYSRTPRIFSIPSQHGQSFLLVEANEQIGNLNSNQEGQRAPEIVYENY